jgi:hypothetical protein
VFLREEFPSSNGVPSVDDLTAFIAKAKLPPPVKGGRRA